jgi:AbrB family looped-hinge helix DNA binding protein
MQYSKITRKFQVTIPKEVRQAVRVKAGETVIVEAHGEDGVLIRRLPKEGDPLKVLIGKKPIFDRHIPIEELEERMEE